MHLNLATDRQLERLQDTKTWYVNCMLEIAKAPFELLFSNHAFTRSGTAYKQVSLVFVMMSSRHCVDYEAIQQEPLDILLDRQGNEVVADFEAAWWQAVCNIVPEIEMKGCLFHFTQAVYRKIKALGLSPSNQRDEGTQTLCRKPMTLPLLPHKHVPAVW